MLIPLIGGLLLRNPLEKRLVTSKDLTGQPGRQFGLDVSLYIAAGTIAAVWGYFQFSIPPSSGVKMMLGFVVTGFFGGLDMALAREREIILLAARQKDRIRPPSRLFPMTRKFSIFAITAAALVSAVLAMIISNDSVWLAAVGPNTANLSEAFRSVVYEVLFVMAVLLALVLNLIRSYSKNLKILFQNETRVLESVSRGDLARTVPVATRDEFGLIAGHTNEMIQGLRHRTRLLEGLRLAEEVQQNLLPETVPRYEGIDLAGFCRYCDRVGGDYFDYLDLPGRRLGILVADVDGHGIGSALFMSAARAFIRSSLERYRSPEQLIGDINRFLSSDSRDSGRFTALFFLEIDPGERSLKWVRAGSEPALAYDPGQKRVVPLDGKGVALGVLKDYSFAPSGLTQCDPGTVVIISTDGLKETRNAKNEMYGRQRLEKLMAETADLSAEQIQLAVVDSLDAFRGDQAQEDDLTLVVVKWR